MAGSPCQGAAEVILLGTDDLHPIRARRSSHWHLVLRDTSEILSVSSTSLGLLVSFQKTADCVLPHGLKQPVARYDSGRLSDDERVVHQFQHGLGNLVAGDGRSCTRGLGCLEVETCAYRKAPKN